MNDKEKLFSYYKYALQMLETEINILMDEFVLKHGYNPESLILHPGTKQKGNSDVFDKWYCYVFPHIVGALCATFLFKFYYEKTYYKIYMLKLK